MTFISLDQQWKVWVYRWGLIGSCFSLFGLILLGINANLNYEEDIWKTKKDPKLNGLIEKFFFLCPFIGIITIVILIILDV